MVVFTEKLRINTFFRFAVFSLNNLNVSVIMLRFGLFGHIVKCYFEFWVIVTVFVYFQNFFRSNNHGFNGNI